VPALTTAASAVAAEPSTAAAIELVGVTRSFGPNPALRDLTLAVPTARITVLVGPNGAGKTTAIRMVTGALSPDAGTVRVFGLDPAVEGEDVRRRCGVVTAKPSLYDRLSGWDNLAYSAELYGLGRGPAAARAIRSAAERFEIAHALDQQAGGYSTGMKSRLALARSLLHEPDLLLFDEPTSGLDPESSIAVLGLIRDLTTAGRTVVMCTHLLLEAEGLADQVVVLDGGHVLIAGTPAALTHRYWPGAVVHVDAEDRAGLGSALDGAAGVMRHDERPGGPVVVQVDDLSRVPDLVGALTSAGVRLTRVEPHQPSLEDLYFAVRGRPRPAIGGAIPRDDADR